MAQVMRVHSDVGPGPQHIISFDRSEVDTKRGGRLKVMKAVGGNTANKKPAGGAPASALARTALPGASRPRGRR